MKTLVTASFPKDHLAPWMSVHDRRKIAALAALRNIGDIGKELDERVDRDAHPENYKELQDNYDPTKARGAAGMFAMCTTNYASHVHDLAVSEGGLGRKQAMGGVIAQKAGVAPEIKKRSFVEKLTGRGKDKDQMASPQ